jgi:proteasome assembly chaperone (PAC2) family protein
MTAQTWIFSSFFSKNTHISNVTQIRPVAAEFHVDRRTDGQTDMKLIVAFRNFAIFSSFSKNTHISVTQIRPVAAEFHVDRRTDGHEVNSRFSQFYESA